MTQVNLSMKHTESYRKQTRSCQGKGLGEGWSGRLRLANVSSYT